MPEIRDTPKEGAMHRMESTRDRGFMYMFCRRQSWEGGTSCPSPDCFIMSFYARHGVKSFSAVEFPRWGHFPPLGNWNVCFMLFYIETM